MIRIAVVNDNTDFLTLMAEVLEDMGWEAHVIREADQAYQRLKDMRPDLVILDIRMGSPENGWSILEVLKLDPDTRHIPVIVCSAALDELQAKAPWLQDHGILTLPKPFDIDDLYATVEGALQGATNTQG